jgi:hypothetical protein
MDSLRKRGHTVDDELLKQTWGSHDIVKLQVVIIILLQQCQTKAG